MATIWPAAAGAEPLELRTGGHRRGGPGGLRGGRTGSGGINGCERYRLATVGAGRYGASLNQRFGTAPNQQTNTKLVSDVLSDVLTRAFKDPTIGQVLLQ